jgi:hypothetical protein
MKLLTIEIFIHKVYSRQGGFIEQYYQGILLGKEFGEEKKLGEATGDTEQEVIDDLTNWVKHGYCVGEKFKIKVLD